MNLSETCPSAIEATITELLPSFRSKLGKPEEDGGDRAVTEFCRRPVPYRVFLLMVNMSWHHIEWPLKKRDVKKEADVFIFVTEFFFRRQNPVKLGKTQ